MNLHTRRALVVVVYFSVIVSLAVLFLSAFAKAQTLDPDYFGGVAEPDMSQIQTPAYPDVVEGSPSYLCSNGVRPSCSLVNDWYCFPETACAGAFPFSYAEVYAPASFSPLGIEQPWYDHWWASRETLKQTQAALEACQAAQVAPPPANPSCQSFADGANRGRLWKPSSDSTGKVVVLMPESYREQSPTIQDAAGKVLSKVTRKSCCPNGNRAHFWFDKAASQLPKPTYLAFDGECFEINDPTKRVD
jgi:hypothetical protein